MTTHPRTYRGASAISGPLLYLPRTRGVALGEWVTIRLAGTGSWRGQVIDAGEEVTVIQVLEDTFGLSPARVEVTLSGAVATAVVGRELLGRAFNGVGEPIDSMAAPVGEASLPIWGAPANPARRLRPRDFIETGISAIDGMNTLVRGQKLPIFSSAGLPAMELASFLVENARVAGEEERFAVVFVAIGITARETHSFLERFEESGAMDRSVLYVNEAKDPTIERLLAPRIALTEAEFLAFTSGFHVLVVLADMTHYCEALREIGTAREEIPGRRGYPGYMYTDLASLFERAGILKGREGSLTQLPILTMPDDDMTHPIPDLTGYITEGQIVLSRELSRRGVFPPIDVLPSLSRLMNAGIGAGKTVPEHRAWADGLYAVYSRGQEARLMSAIVGEAGLGPADRRALDFAEKFESEFVAQGASRRSLSETVELGWKLLSSLPREDVMRIDEDNWAKRGRAS
jgi:V/A-type H+-transporting ATPase subunit B